MCGLFLDSCVLEEMRVFVCVSVCVCVFVHIHTYALLEMERVG